MSVMFEASDAATLKERLELAVCRLKELHQEGLPELKKTGKPFACFLRNLIEGALEQAGAMAENTGKEEELSPKEMWESTAAGYPELVPYLRLLSEETLRITDHGLEEDVIRLELVLQILGEIFSIEEDAETVLKAETFQEALYWFYSDYSEPVLTKCLTEAASMGVSFPTGYGKKLSYTPGFLEWGDLAGNEPHEFLALFDANLATRRMEAFSEAMKTAGEMGGAPKLEYVVPAAFCAQNRNYRHFVKRLKETTHCLWLTP